MTSVPRPVVAQPILSLQLLAFAAEAPDSWQHVLDRAVVADRAGIGKVVVSDHVAFGEAMEAYGDASLGGQSGARQPTGPDGHWLEPLTLLSVIAGMTSQVRLGTNILLAALRRPAVLAKTVATLDVLSGGRVDLGVGVGWQKEEYDACGLDFANRGRLLNHCLEVCQELWTETVADYASEELHFERIHAMPKPLQPAGVPLWISGTINDRSMKRLALHGSGWIPWGPDAHDMVDSIGRMRSAVAKFDRDPQGIAVVGTLPVVRTDERVDLDATMDRVPALVAAGVTDFRAYLPVPDGVEAGVEYLSDVVARFDVAVDST